MERFPRLMTQAEIDRQLNRERRAVAVVAILPMVPVMVAVAAILATMVL